jgi:dihydroxy-acid dehydratase
VGGPIGLVQDGDIITVDVEKRKINVELTEAELANRRKNWRAPPLKACRGTLYKV